MIRQDWLSVKAGSVAAWLAALISCGVVALAWFGYQAAEEWRRSSSQLLDRRSREIGDLLVTAFARDMRAVQVSVLDGRDWDATSVRAPHNLNDTVEVAFARYPYPETFFVWDCETHAASFFARSDRRPAWLPTSGRDDRYPVEVLQSPPDARPLFGRIERDVSSREQYSIFEITVGGRAYQAVARLLYDNATRDRPVGAFGFIVDLSWVRQHYFAAIADQVMRIAQATDGVTVSIVNDRGEPVVGSRPGSVVDRHPFALLFFDPIIIAGGAPDGLVARTWSVNVGPGSDPTLDLAARGARRTLVVVGASALALGLGLFVTVRAARAVADTAEMRAEFVSAVTHGLKTPVSVIRGIGETLSRGRVTTPDRLKEYAQLLVQEGHRLTRLIDNMLAYARVTEAASVYSFEPQSPGDIVDEVLRGFSRIFLDANVSADVSIADELPAVRADRTSMVLALDNLVDNAIRYSGESRNLGIRVRAANNKVEFSVIDHGPGIAAADLALVTRRFVRGRSTSAHGSGLGLSIASRIATDHGGRLRMESTLGAGTTATLEIPAQEG